MGERERERVWARKGFLHSLLMISTGGVSSFFVICLVDSVTRDNASEKVECFTTRVPLLSSVVAPFPLSFRGRAEPLATSAPP